MNRSFVRIINLFPKNAFPKETEKGKERERIPLDPHMRSWLIFKCRTTSCVFVTEITHAWQINANRINIEWITDQQVSSLHISSMKIEHLQFPVSPRELILIVIRNLLFIVFNWKHTFNRTVLLVMTQHPLVELLLWQILLQGLTSCPIDLLQNNYRQWLSRKYTWHMC